MPSTVNLISQPSGSGLSFSSLEAKKTKNPVDRQHWERPADATREHPEAHPPLRPGVLPLRRPRQVVHEVNPTVGVGPLLWEETQRQEDETAARTVFQALFR